MCGIAAIFNYRHGEPIDRAELTTIRDAMALRGPDAFGEWISADGCVGLGHRRLSIIDLSPTGAQPMPSADGSLMVTFNGEIYNYRELRSALEAEGCRFRSTSDTEVLLHLYEREGREMVHKLRGMFAFAIWDSRRQGLFLARDPFGIKPLFYADDGKTLRAASQVKALLAGGHVDTSVEPAGHVGFFLWGFVPSPFTLYRGVRGLKAGSSLWFDRQGNRQETAFSSVEGILGEAEAKASESPSGVEARKELLLEALRDSVRHHLIADVPVGVFLSSGIDSAVITALASETNSDLRTVTLAFKEYEGTPQDESVLAAEVAARYGARHQTVWVGKQDFRDSFARVLQAMDQPSCDGINSYFISLAAARAGLKVALSGLGGDELFGGYPSFREIPDLVRYLQPFRVSAVQPFSRAFRLLSAPLLKRFTSPKYAGLFEYGGSWGGAYLLRRGLFMPWELPEVLDPDLARQGWDDLQPLARIEKAAGQVRSPYLKVTALEMAFYMRQQLLRDADWASMTHSLEVRTPLVDAWLLRALAPVLANGTPPGKRDLARAPARELPAAILGRPKTGFTVPVREWLIEEDKRFELYRGLRGWARLIYSAQLDQNPVRDHSLQSGFGFLSQTTKRRPARRTGDNRILALLPDGFGGRGGIAKFNRDLLTALCSCPEVAGVTAIPRLIFEEAVELPPKLEWKTDGLGGKISFMRAVAREALRARRRRTAPRLIVCGHINLLPAAFLARRLLGSQRAGDTGQGAKGVASRAPPPIVLIVHGIDAWQPGSSRLSNALVGKVHSVVAVSRVTRDRFAQWSGFPPGRIHILPNSVDLSQFKPGPKPESLLKRYGLQGRKVLITLGRLASQERQKGFDEMIEILPELARKIPGLSYMIVGDGDDRPRLVQKASDLGLRVVDCAPGIKVEGGAEAGSAGRNPQPQVIFTGYVAEAEKADHYRAADLYVMPSRGEGFGIVYLEALACGLPVIGSKVDGSREALRDGLLGTLVDPADRQELKDAIHRQLGQRTQRAPEGLSYFSYAEYEHRCHHLIRQLVGDPKAEK